MQVTCPNCGARYAVDPLAIGPVGRIVQCARCANRWHQTVAAAKADAAARDAVDAAMNSPETAPGARSDASMASADAPPRIPSFGSTDRSSPEFSPRPAAGLPAGPSLGSARAVEDPVDAAPDFVIRPPRERTSLPAVIEPRRPSRLPMQLAALCLLIVFIGAGVAVYFLREPILAHLPADLRDLLKL